jgi:GTP-binding protein
MKKRAIVTESPRAAKDRTIAEKPVRPLAGAVFETAVTELAALPPAGAPEIAVAGRSNAGKSSAINALAHQHRLAFASRTPGRTRQINFFRLRCGALLADLPGYGYAAVPDAIRVKWQALLWQYLTTRSTLVGLVLAVDARHSLKDLDLQVLDAFVPSVRPVLVLATKSDKLNVAERNRAVRDLEQRITERFGGQSSFVSVIAFSSTTRLGVEAAEQTLAQWLPG